MTIDERALDSLSVAPDDADAQAAGGSRDPRQDAGQDRQVAERLQRNPDSVEARLDSGLDETMDASDPVAVSQPDASSDPVPSSGYDEEAERQRDA
ncbi:hypothetical protein GCM10011380_01120 [Sphingomonas metalli]|uniref:Uncharacterized protein n=1 Tax=Sphingomonas metalli TaxID=1779358 RepID=A0A916WMR3_9SPHN|nr:hypothetical protein [Sphingomonas metalli]GGB15458.1 hypothetical protein GCM10011380_01120 [Sphingomonas metalli]